MVIDVDDTPLSVYGISESNKSTFQRIFQLPERNKVKLPYRTTGSNSPKPYLEIKGECKNKGNAIDFALNFPDIKSKSPKFNSVLNININSDNHEIKDSKETINIENSEIKVKINKSDYIIDGISIYDHYVNSNIIAGNALKSEMFEKISKQFFKFIKNKWTFDLYDKKERKPKNFSLIILPSNKDVHYLLPSKKNAIDPSNESNAFDSFGNETSGFPSETTQTAKFLSFDDPAFALNCKEKKDFYKNLAIGKSSLKSINIADDEVFNISGLNWIFTNLDDPTFKFRYTNKGIYHQLLSNYNDLKQKSGDDYTRQSFMKVICFEKKQKKLEILLDENLTMRSMRRMFLKFDNEQSQHKTPVFSLEIFIEKIKKGNGEKRIWTTYLNAVDSLIHGNSMSSESILAFLRKQIKSKIFDWLSDTNQNKSEIIGFFEKSEFCMKILTRTSLSMNWMSENEKYAYQMGLIAGQYVKFKKSAKEDSNSLKDILTYSKYDREKLRNVFHRIGLGVNFSTSNKEEMNNILNFIKENCPLVEITEDEAHKDFSYFFYKGVFQQLC